MIEAERQVGWGVVGIEPPEEDADLKSRLDICNAPRCTRVYIFRTLKIRQRAYIKRYYLSRDILGNCGDRISVRYFYISIHCTPVAEGSLGGLA